jgi:L-alanine-DL-glutamate epimerase-like enolase superfamily enzyme
MRIVRTTSWREDVPLARPYAIAGGAWDTAQLVFVALETDEGDTGYGLAAPAEEVTGEDAAAAAGALTSSELGWLLDSEVGVASPSSGSPVWAGDVAARVKGPAARAAVDMALWDLVGRRTGVKLVDVFGRVHGALPTSVTIGVKSVAATLEEAEEYVGRGLVCLKVKGGVDVDEDIERLARLRERFGARVTLRCDANMGYDTAALARLVARMQELALELVEQPLTPALDAALLEHEPWARARFVADESVHGVDDLERLAALGAPFGAVNIKLMKCGGPTPARALAAAAHRAGLGVMWGCMDESALGIAAALHTAYAAPATRWLDLDGSLDLARDPFVGGFTLDGPASAPFERRDYVQPLDRPGLGAEPAPPPCTT